MSLDKDLEKLAQAAITGFNSKTGTNLKLEDIEYNIRRPGGWKAICGLQLVTKAGDDFVRFQVDVNGFDKYTSMTGFTLKIRQNSTAGNLNNEVFIADAILGLDEYKYLRVYLSSPEFKSFAAFDPVLPTKSGKALMLALGLPLFIQN